MILDRVRLVRLARIRIRFAKRVRDRNLRHWIKYKIQIIREVKRLELIALEEAEKKRLQDLEK